MIVVVVVVVIIIVVVFLPAVVAEVIIISAARAELVVAAPALALVLVLLLILLRGSFLQGSDHESADITRIALDLEVVDQSLGRDVAGASSEREESVSREGSEVGPLRIARMVVVRSEIDEGEESVEAGIFADDEVDGAATILRHVVSDDLRDAVDAGAEDGDEDFLEELIRREV